MKITSAPLQGSSSLQISVTKEAWKLMRQEGVDVKNTESEGKENL